MKRLKELDLAVVIPVYNEEACIEQVIDGWILELSKLKISYMIIVLNDGSKDRTGDVLSLFLENPEITIVNKLNSGHGPTILQGYRSAVKIAPWVFQCDSDNEMKPAYFQSLWIKRDSYDALFGIRDNRHQNIPRKIISFFSRLTIRTIFGKGIADVNTPYRLMRASVLKNIIEKIPLTLFAPNVIISGALIKLKARVYQCRVPHVGRKTGQESIVKWKLWISACKSFFQTVRCISSFSNSSSKTF